MARPTIDEQWATNVQTSRKVFIKIEQLHFIANGVFSNVYSGQQVVPQVKPVAVKKTWSKNHVPLKEIEILSLLRKKNAPNIVQLLYTFENKNHPNDKCCYGLVFEYMPMTLYKHAKQLRKQKKKMQLTEVKLYTWQLFNAQLHLAKNSICHRDIKPQNILIDPDSGLLKLADFGSSKIIVKGGRSTSYQVTRHYRPPELLLGAEDYGPEVDVWSCGCVFGELLRGNILMHGRTTSEQFLMVVERLGFPTSEEYSAMKCRPNSYDISKTRIIGNKFGDLMPGAPLEAVQLINRILVYNPADRLSGYLILSNPFFAEIFSQVTRSNKEPIQHFTNEAIGVMDA